MLPGREGAVVALKQRPRSDGCLSARSTRAEGMRDMRHSATTSGALRRLGCGALAVTAWALAAGAPEAIEMVFPGEEWVKVSPQSEGIDPAALDAAIGYLAGHSGRDGARELVVVRDGRMVWSGDNIDHAHGVWSLTKSFTSTALGLLIDDGRVSLDTLAQDYLPEMAAAYPAVTLRHFATMTSGYRAVGDEPMGGYVHGPSVTPFIPSPEPLFSPPGSQYAYWDSAMNQFANVLTRIAGEPLDELLRRRVADPIGMNATQWRWGRLAEIQGLPVNGGSGNSDAVALREVGDSVETVAICRKDKNIVAATAGENVVA